MERGHCMLLSTEQVANAPPRRYGRGHVVGGDRNWKALIHNFILILRCHHLNHCLVHSLLLWEWFRRDTVEELLTRLCCYVLANNILQHKFGMDK